MRVRAGEKPAARGSGWLCWFRAFSLDGRPLLLSLIMHVLTTVQLGRLRGGAVLRLGKIARTGVAGDGGACEEGIAGVAVSLRLLVRKGVR